MRARSSSLCARSRRVHHTILSRLRSSSLMRSNLSKSSSATSAFSTSASSSACAARRPSAALGPAGARPGAPPRAQGQWGLHGRERFLVCLSSAAAGGAERARAAGAPRATHAAALAAPACLSEQPRRRARRAARARRAPPLAPGGLESPIRRCCRARLQPLQHLLRARLRRRGVEVAARGRDAALQPVRVHLLRRAPGQQQLQGRLPLPKLSA
jgi:hypothetical protein